MIKKKNLCVCYPAPHSGVGGTACVFPKSPVKGYFSCDKVRPENCIKKKGGGGIWLFTRRFLLKRGCFFFLSLFGRLRNLKRGFGYKILKKNYSGYIEQRFGFRGVSKAGKAYEKPAKGGFRNKKNKKKIIGGTLSSVLDLGGSPRQEKPTKSPRKGGSEILSVRR